MASTFSVEVELKSSAQKIWEAINDLPNFAPKAFPHVFDSIVALEGDGNSAGTIRTIKYAEGRYIDACTLPVFLFVNCVIDFIIILIMHILHYKLEYVR